MPHRHDEQGWDDWRPAEPQYTVNPRYLSFGAGPSARLNQFVEQPTLNNSPVRTAKGDDNTVRPWTLFPYTLQP